MNMKSMQLAAIVAFVAATMSGTPAWVTFTAKPSTAERPIEFVHAKKKRADAAQASKASTPKAAKPAAKGGAHTHPPRS